MTNSASNMAPISVDTIDKKLERLQALVQSYRDAGTTFLSETQLVQVSKAAHDLKNFANPPRYAGLEVTMMLMAMRPYIATAARLAVDLGIFQILTARSPQTPESIAKQALDHTGASEVDPDFIARIMRLLIYQGLVTEGASNTYFANANTRAFGEHNSSLESLLGHFYDFYMPVLDHSVSYFAGHGYKLPDNPRVGPFQSFYQTDKATYDYWLDQPRATLRRLNNMMYCLHSTPWYEWMQAPKMIAEQLSRGVDSPTVEDETKRLLLVDVGGGRGVSLKSLQDQLNADGIKGTLILEDRAGAIEEFRAETPEPTHPPGVRITPLEHDFFLPQPAEARGSPFYFMRHILHNWNDADCVSILSSLVSALRPRYSRLLINEQVIQPVENNLHAVGLDFHMAFSHASRERSLKEYEKLVQAAGLRVVAYHRSPDGGEDIVECML